MNRYLITNDTGEEVARVMARGHEQEIWNEGRLRGISSAGCRKLDARPDGERLYYSHDGNGTAQGIRLRGYTTS